MIWGRGRVSPNWQAMRWLISFALAFALGEAARAAAVEPLAARVILLANADDPDSLRVARHYAAARGVPGENIIALKMPLTEVVTWREFLVTVWDPLMALLVRDKWIDAIPMEATDSIGRKKYAVYSHRIAALISCRGVPLKIAHDPALFTEVLPFTNRGEFRTNAGSVDTELSLLSFPNYPINAFMPNPLFQNDRPSRFELTQVVKVSRLDGPTVEDAMGLVDRALEAERTGLLGRAYVDIAGRDALGDGWFESTARQLAALDFDLTVDRAGATMPATARIDAPVLYFGWYSGTVDGPFTLPGFRFPPGAIALHLHSFSANSLRVSHQGWTAPFIARGVTATVGNVYEPYLQFTHRPNLLVRALVRGANLVDAAYYSVQSLSWQQVLIGDPLYRPFAVSLEAQMKEPGRLPPRLAGYAVLRRMHELDDAKREAEATALAVSTQRESPSLAVGLALAERLLAAKDRDAAASALGFVPLLKNLLSEEWALVRQAAEMLEALGRTGRALDVWRGLLAVDTLPASMREPWLRQAAKTARATNDLTQALAWEKAADLLLAGKK